MGVDFVKSDSGGNRSKGNGYDIEYSNPITEPDEVKPKHANLLNAIMGKGANSRIPMPSTSIKKATDMSSAQSAEVTATAVSRSAQYKPMATAATRSTGARSIATAASTPAPVTARLTERHLPPPPPPPTHTSVPVAPVQPVKPVTQPIIPVVAAIHELPLQSIPKILPTAESTQKPEIAPVTPVMAPAPATHDLPPAPAAPSHTKPTPVISAVPTQTAPIVPAAVAPKQPMAPVRAAAPVKTSVAASAPMATGHHATSVGEVVAQNVTGLRGETTHPDALTPQLVGVNLLPNAIQQPLQQQMPLYRLLRTCTVVMICFTLAYLGMVGYQAFFIWRTQATLSELADLDTQILTYRTLQQNINTTSATLGGVQEVLDNHIYWSQWFTYLEEHTLPTVYYNGFSGSSNGTMNLQAVAPDFVTVSQQIETLRALPEVSAVTVSTATRSESSFAETTGDANQLSASTMQFTISLQVNPSIVHYQPNGLYE